MEIQEPYERLPEARSHVSRLRETISSLHHLNYMRTQFPLRVSKEETFAIPLAVAFHSAKEVALRSSNLYGIEITSL